MKRLTGKEEMKNILWRSFGILGLCLLFSCKETAVNQSVIDVATAMNQLKEISASDCFTDIQYIRLETTDSSLVGNSPDVQVIQDRILVSAQNRCMLFDKATGKFLTEVGHAGNDPGGYSIADFWTDEPQGLIYFKGWHNDLVCYNLEGRYVGNIKVPVIADEKYPRDYSFLNNDTIVGYYENMTGEEKERILIFNKEGKELTLIPNEQTTLSFEIDNVSVLKGEKAVELYGPSALRGALMLNSTDPDLASFSMFGKANFWHVKGESFFQESYNDTIYRIENNNLVPRLVFDLGTYHWNYSERFMKKQDRNIYISQVLESSQTLFFRLITGIYRDDKRQLYNAVFDKTTGNVKVDLLKNGLTDNINHFIPLQPLSVSGTGEYVGVLSSEAVLDWFEQHPENEPLSAAVAPLKLVKEEDNPVIVLMKSN